MSRLINCIKLKKEAEGLDFQPVPGDIGKKIWENVSKEAWNQWIQHQTMLVNEYRLNLSDVKARKYLMDQMDGYFFGDGADAASGYTPPKG
ncbi:MAG: oxidative damage protection protein [Betaproteobacteria bacterium TMED156]|nr:MAG: oxidative damage protection protein [Betaproteobacteria bacterium TMED156]|tara:strand:+ start:285 stop:557 length:273 start_codon:yes stop_codon:yes gene_type:complete